LTELEILDIRQSRVVGSGHGSMRGLPEAEGGRGFRDGITDDGIKNFKRRGEPSR